MKPRKLEKGEIVQIAPTGEASSFGGCLMVVTDPASWGAAGYVTTPGHLGAAHYRCLFEHMEPTGGTVRWLVD